MPDDFQRKNLYEKPALDTPALRRPAAVVRHRCHVRNAGDLESKCIQGAHRRFAAGARALDPYLKVLDPAFLRRLAGRLGGDLRRERRRLARALEAGAAGRRPGQCVALAIGDGDDRVVERRVDMRNAFGDVLLDLLARPRDGLGRCLCHALCPQSFDRRLQFTSTTWLPAWQRGCSPAWRHATLTPAGPSLAPCVSARWCGCADRGPAIPCDGARPDSNRGP